MGSDRYVHLDVKLIKAETEAAFLFVLDDGDDTEVWIPRSQMADPDDHERGDADCSIAITEWIARQKGLEVD